MVQSLLIPLREMLPGRDEEEQAVELVVGPCPASERQESTMHCMCEAGKAHTISDPSALPGFVI